jgi:HSP90 family molecular chaperone
MKCFSQKKYADWSKEMNDLINYIGDQQRQKIDSTEILEDVKDRLISFLIDHKGLD